MGAILQEFDYGILIDSVQVVTSLTCPRPTRKRGKKITTRGVSEGQRWKLGIPLKVSQHALRASG